MRTSKALTYIGLAAAAIAVACFIGWFASREPAGEPHPQAVTETDAEKAANPIFSSSKAKLTAKDVADAEAAAAKKIADAKSATDDAVNAAYAAAEEKFDEILGSAMDTDKQAEEMLKLYPKISPAAKKDAIEHILNLVSDEGFAPVGKILTNPKTPEAVADSIMNDLGNRPGSTRLPLLLQIAKMKDHPKAAEAKEFLEVDLQPDEDPGDNWDEWEKLTKTYLEENPD